MTFGAEKLEWCGYRTVKKIEDMFFVSTESTNVTDGQHMTAKAALHSMTPRDKNERVRG